MLKNNEPYRCYARPALMREKFTKLRLLEPGRVARRTPKQPKLGLTTV
jgi:hypothetical protein